ncbi:MAG: hypothetical protein QOE54_6500 [Streptosporangiaceae bacterium]|nr:hypothetical protein [Streptosporangiaceae bacterium]
MAPRRMARLRHCALGWAPFAFTWQRRPARSSSSILTPRTSSARAAVSYSIRHSVFSRRWTSRRAISRSIAIFERAGVSECGTVSRFAHAGAAGPS